MQASMCIVCTIRVSWHFHCREGGILELIQSIEEAEDSTPEKIVVVRRQIRPASPLPSHVILRTYYLPLPWKKREHHTWENIPSYDSIHFPLNGNWNFSAESKFLCFTLDFISAWCFLSGIGPQYPFAQSPERPFFWERGNWFAGSRIRRCCSDIGGLEGPAARSSPFKPQQLIPATTCVTLLKIFLKIFPFFIWGFPAGFWPREPGSVFG